MWLSLVYIVFFCFLHYTAGYSQLAHDICGNNTQRARSCTTQILGDSNADINKCHVEYYPANSNACKAMDFGPITSNAHIGGVSLKPYILSVERRGNGSAYSLNRAVLNITFSNIKWQMMKFRFQPANQRNVENHCRDIILSNDVKINDRSILYYDCYWPIMDGNFNGQSHILDFEATGENGVNRGQYYFNIPSAKMLSQTVSEEEWLPFLYIEILTTGTMKLHIMPPPKQLNITEYEIKIMKEADKGTQVEKVTKVQMKNNTHEVTYDYSLLHNGSYHFIVTPLHERCKVFKEECQSVESPKIIISSDVQTLNICIASVTALIVATLFAYYIALRVIRRYWCKDYSLAMGNEIPPPTKVLVIYSPANRLHAECVSSFVTYLRSEYGLDVMFDGDISSTSHSDPFIWANEAFRLASHVMYVVGPVESTNLYNNIYDKPVTAYQGIDNLLLALIKADKKTNCPKEFLNVFFEHSNGKIPIETRHEKVFFLLKDWQKLIAYLSKNMLPRKLLTRTEKGKCFLDDLSRARNLLMGKRDDVVIKCEKLNFSDKKVLI